MCSNGMFGMQNPNERSARPTAWSHDAASTFPSIELKFHHVISWDCLRDTWQVLLEHGHWNALEAYLVAVGVNAGSASSIRGKLHRGESMDGPSLETVFEKLSWPGWNIVQGPGNRSDEGGSDVDLFTDGMSSQDKARMTNLGLLWTEMDSLLTKVGPPGRAELKKRREASRPGANPQPVTVSHAPHDVALSDAASRLARALGKMANYKLESYIPYIHSMWETVSAGAVNKTARGVWDAVPQFRKVTAPPRTLGNLPSRMRCKHCSKAYERPAVPPRCKIWCPECGKQTVVDFEFAAA